MKACYMAIPGVPSANWGHDVIQANRIISAVCSYFSLSDEAIKTKRRFRRIVLPRQIVMHFLLKYTKLGVTNIGRMFSMDHTSVLHANQTILNLLFSDEVLKAHMRKIENKILS